MKNDEEKALVKSRLVARGDQEHDKDEHRSDAPTADEAGEHLVLSWCISMGVPVRIGNIKNHLFKQLKNDILLSFFTRYGLFTSNLS